jgi:hypothetical protein
MILAIILAVAVQAARDTKPAPQTSHATIRGRIVAGDTGQPLNRARITLSAPELTDGDRVTSTNRDGRYEIDNLPAGRYTIAVARPGYLMLRYGQRRPREQGKTIEIRDNQRIDDVNFALPRASLITGRITDETGEPIPDVRVTALRPVYVSGLRQLAPDVSSAAATDSNGEYRITGLTPGAYAVMATFNDTWTAPQGGVDTQMGYAPTYFPGTSNVAGARRLTLGIGQEARNTDFSLVTGRTVTVSGAAFDSHGRPLQNVVVLQISVGGAGAIRTFGGPGTVRVTDDGAFSIRNVPPGDYQLMASGHDELASIPITVDGADLVGLALVGTAGWSITGRVVTEEGDVPALAPRVVSVSAFTPGPLSFFQLQGQPGYAQKLNADWTFSVTGVTGSARLRVGLPPGWMLKAVLQNDKDISDTPLELESGTTLSRVQLIITNQLAGMSGQVTDDKGAPISDGTIVLFPADPAKWYENSRHIRSARPNQTGQFEMTGLLPGDYLAIAVDYVEQGNWNDPEYLESLRSRATTVTLSAGRSVDLRLPLITP